MNEITLPHHKLDAYRVSLELLRNVAEWAGRSSRADKARVNAIARGEVCEGCAEDVAKVNAVGKRLCDMLGRLVG